MTGRWFYTGQLMEDGKTRISVRAGNEMEEGRFLGRGWQPVGFDETGTKKSKVVRRRRKPTSRGKP